MKRFLPLFAVLLLVLVAGAFRYTYTLPPPTVCVSADRMNIMYAGIDNPITVAVPGVTSDKLIVKASTGTVRGDSGRYIIVPDGTSEAISVRYTDASGKEQDAGAALFRVKRVPDPVAYVGPIKGSGSMSKPEVVAVRGVFSRMENFDFDTNFKVLSFDVVSTLGTIQQPALHATGPAVTAEMTKQFAQLKSGDRLSFENIHVKGLDGTERDIPGVVITIK